MLDALFGFDHTRKGRRQRIDLIVVVDDLLQVVQRLVSHKASRPAPVVFNRFDQLIFALLCLSKLLQELLFRHIGHGTVLHS